jgi:hypothetical protein
VNKTLGMILVTLGLFALAWGGFTVRDRKRLLKSDRFMLLATRHIMYR